jgi:hypothetical protein
MSVEPYTFDLGLLFAEFMGRYAAGPALQNGGSVPGYLAIPACLLRGAPYAY